MGDKDQVRETMEGVKNNVSQISDDIRNRASRMASDLNDRATEYYDDASTWMQANYGKVLVAVGVIAAVGVAGYFITRSDKDAA